jgi:hypothetical protein
MNSERMQNGMQKSSRGEVLIGRLFESGPIIHTLDLRVPKDDSVRENPGEVVFRSKIDDWVHGRISYKELMGFYPLNRLDIISQAVTLIKRLASGRGN